MRKFLLVSLLAFACIYTHAQITSISVEEYYTDDGLVTNYPAGYTTYRIYANCTNENDVVATIYGEVQSPLLFTLNEGCIWNSPFGAEKADDLNPVFCGIDPSTCYDSFITIGRENSGTPGGAIFLLEDAAQPFSNEFGNSETCGGSFVVNSQVGGAWFGLPGDANCFAGPDLKVLIMQVTTNGTFSGQFNIQCFPSWENAGDAYLEQTGLQFTSGGEVAIYGCMDATAVNYNENATADDGSCLICDLAFANVTSSTPTCSNSTNGSVAVVMTTTSDFFPKYSLNGGAYTFGTPPLQKSYNNLSSGNYTVSVRDTKWDDPNFNPGGVYGTCIVSTTVNMVVNPVTIGASTPVNVSCNGAANGSVVNAGANGGTGTFDYYLQYSPENTNVLDEFGNPIVQDNPNFSGLLPDCYRIQAIDDNGCVGNSTQFCISQPAAVFLIVTGTIPATCSNTDDGAVSMTWGGGTGDVDWSIDNIDGPYIDGTNFIEDVPAGNHIMYGMDANGCIDDIAFTIVAPAPITVSANITDALCVDAADGSITATAAGGNNSNFTYSLDGENFGSGTFTGLEAGEYTVYAMNANGCEGTNTFTIAEPTALTSTSTSTDVSCFGEEDGCVNISVSGGTAPYLINGTNLTQFCGLGAGTYTYDVVDANGCTSTAEGSVSEPAALEGTSTSADVTCNGDEDGVIVITGTGGVEPYNYSNNCGDNFQSSNEFDGLDIGSYCIVIEDSNGCQTTVGTIDITEPEELEGAISIISGVDEDGGDIDLTVTGGTPTYTYEWSGPNGFSADTQDINGLDDAGTYTVVVTDDNGCSWTEQVTITSLDEVGSFYTISVSPNPTSGRFNLTLGGVQNQLILMQVTDAQGRLVVQRNINKNQEVVVEALDITQLESGVYFLNLTVGQQLETIKIIKQ